MSYNNSMMNSGSRRAFEFGRTYVVRPKGKHQATVVWLHGLSDNGSSWSALLDSLPLRNIKWICPTAPIRPVAIFGGYQCTSWFDVGDISEDAPDDLEGLDASAAHVANLLSTEPRDIPLGIGGFSMGAALALYSATCHVLGRFGNGVHYPVNLNAVVGLSGWLPCARNLVSQMQTSYEAVRRAASLPILMCHGFYKVIYATLWVALGTVDDVVPYKHGERSAQVLSSIGFRNLIFRSYHGLGNYTIPEEIDEVCTWLATQLGLVGPQN